MIKTDKPQPFDGGRFFLLGPVGRGGSGEVYRAKQAGLERIVAIKVLARDLDDEDVSDLALRLKDEARAASRVRHPGLVEVIDAGFDEQLGPYIAYEFLDGGTLEDWLKDKGPIDAKTVYQKFGKTMLNALATLHEAGIVHRDLKPENLVSDSRGVFKLTDLGLANFQGRAVRTKTGMVWGTPGYMAPERLKTPPPRAHPKQDIYAAAMLFVRAISGRMPFRSKTLGAIVREQMEHDISIEDLLALSIEPPLAKVLAKALNRSPDKRTASAATLKTEIAEAINAPKTAKLKSTRVARAPSTVSKGPSNSQNSRLKLIALFIFVIILIIVSLGLLGPNRMQSTHDEVQLLRRAKSLLSRSDVLTNEDFESVGELMPQINDVAEYGTAVLGLQYLGVLAASRNAPDKACELFTKLGNRLDKQKHNGPIVNQIIAQWVKSAMATKREKELIEFGSAVEDIKDKIAVADSLFAYSLESIRRGRKDDVKSRCLTIAKWMMTIDDAKCTEKEKIKYRELIIDSLALPDGDDCRQLFYQWLNGQNAFEIADKKDRRKLYLHAAQGTALSLVPTVRDQNKALALCKEAEMLSFTPTEECEALAVQAIIELVNRPNELTTCAEQAQKAEITLKRARMLEVPKSWQCLIQSVSAMAAIAGPDTRPKESAELLDDIKGEDLPPNWLWWYWRVFSALARAQTKSKEAVERYKKTQAITPATALFYVITRKQNTDLMSLPTAVFR